MQEGNSCSCTRCQIYQISYWMPQLLFLSFFSTSFFFLFLLLLSSLFAVCWLAFPNIFRNGRKRPLHNMGPKKKLITGCQMVPIWPTYSHSSTTFIFWTFKCCWLADWRKRIWTSDAWAHIRSKDKTNHSSLSRWEFSAQIIPEPVRVALCSKLRCKSEAPVIVRKYIYETSV